MNIPISSAFCSLSPGLGTRAVAALGFTLAIAPISAIAAAQVSGNPAAVSIETQNTSVEEILSALGREFNVHYRSSANLEKQLTGTYQGSLQRELIRILEGYDFFISKMSDGRIEVTVLGTSHASGTARGNHQLPIQRAARGRVPFLAQR